MEAAVNAFLITIAIVGGILTPFILIYIFGLIGKLLDGLNTHLQCKLEDIKKLPPFDEVEVNTNPGTHVMTVRFIKRDIIIWQGVSSRNLMSDRETLNFTTEEIKK